MAQGVFIALSPARAFQREVAIAESQRKSASQNLPQDDGEEDATESEEDADEVDGMEGDEEETTQKTESKRHKRHKAEDEKKEMLQVATGSCHPCSGLYEARIQECRH